MSVYLDHAATTPVLPEVVAAMSQAWATVGNPSSLHASGRAARRAVEESREHVAVLLGARPSEVIFTGGGTESDNLAVKGIHWARRASDPRRRRVITSPAEHHAILDTVEWLASAQDAHVTYLPVDAAGAVGPDALAAALDEAPDEVALVSTMWANNETGAVSPIGELAATARSRGVPLHTDAVQAVAYLPVDFAASGADAMSVTGHKLGGPVGTGALLLRRDVACTPVQHGGGQEREVRSGTLDVAGIVGFTVALSAAVARREAQAVRLAALRDRLVDGVRSVVPDVVVTAGDVPRLPGLAHLAFPGCEGDSLLMLLDADGVQCSTGSACSAGVARASHVLLAAGVPEDVARASVRLSLGHTSTDADVDRLLSVIGPAVERARAAGIQNTAGALSAAGAR